MRFLNPLTFLSPFPLPRTATLPSNRPLTMTSAPITFVTGNQNKLREVESILSSDNGAARLRVVARKIDLPELQGEPDDIARQKCLLAAQQVGGPTVRTACP